MENSTLILDTAFETCQVALAQDDILIAEEKRASGGGHDRVLAGMVHSVLADHRVAPEDVKTIIVTTGPGRFTGLRVGIAFARGFALVHGAKVIGVRTDQAIEHDIQAAHPGEKNYAVLIAVKKGESFLRTPDDFSVIPDSQLDAWLMARAPLVGGVLSSFAREACRKSGIRLSPVTEPSLMSILTVGRGVTENAPIVRPYYAASTGAGNFS
jgi:tRNA threonylcarbamoyl adenosine modification protein YeaZ